MLELGTALSLGLSLSSPVQYWVLCLGAQNSHNSYLYIEFVNHLKQILVLIIKKYDINILIKSYLENKGNLTCYYGKFCFNYVFQIMQGFRNPYILYFLQLPGML